MKSKTDLVGVEFHNFKVKENLGSRNGSVFWKCECKCGNIRELATKEINNQHRKSCGCIFKHKEWRKSNIKWNGYEDLPGRLVSKIKRGAKLRDISFDIDIKYLWELYLKQDKKCVYTGITLFFDKISNDRYGNASLDRIDSSKPYIDGNVQWVHIDVNMMKHTYSDSYFIEICKKIAEYRK